MNYQFHVDTYIIDWISKTRGYSAPWIEKRLLNKNDNFTLCCDDFFNFYLPKNWSFV